MAKPEIKVVITADGKQAASEIGKLDDAADKAGKGGLKSLTDKIPGLNSALGNIPGGSELASGGISALGAASLAGGAALAGFAVKGVMAFEDTTLAVGKFRDATGTTSEEASRFVEVFNDLGIGAEAGQAAIGKMEKALGNNSEAFAKYGVEVVRAKDGTIDAQGTFLAAVDALNKIQDPAKRAAAGAAIFGKGWQSMAEIIGSGAPALQSALASVQPSKVFSDADIQSGRDVRDAFDSIRDAGEGLLNTIGKSLAPAIAEIAPALASIVTAAGPLVEILGKGIAEAVKSAQVNIEALQGAADKVGVSYVELGTNLTDFSVAIKHDATGTLSDSLINLAGRQAESNRLTAEATQYTNDMNAAAAKAAATVKDDMAAAAKHAADEISNLTGEYNTLKGSVSDDKAFIDLENTFADVKTKGQEAMDAVKNKTGDADQKMRDYQGSVLDAKSKVIELGQQLGLSIPTVKSMLLQIQDGDIGVVEDRLRVLTRNRTMNIDIITHGGAGYAPAGVPHASGGTVQGWEDMQLVGEQGPELVKLPAGSRVHTASETAGMLAGGGGGTTVNNYFQMPPGYSSPQAFADTKTQLTKRGFRE